MKEFKIITLRECAAGPEMMHEPEAIALYWRRHIAGAIDATREHSAVFLLNTRLRLMGHEIIGMGTLNSVWMEARDVFRLAIVKAAHSVIVAHNHPSGDESPSRNDLKVTRALKKGGAILGIELCDHVIIGRQGRFASLKSLGYL